MKSQDAGPMGGMVRMFMDRMQREQERRAAAAGEEENTAQKALTELQETLAKPAPTSVEIKNKMMAFRGAKEKARQDLAQAQQELTELLTMEQEAMLLMMGVIE